MGLNKFKPVFRRFYLFTIITLLNSCDMVLLNPKGQIGIEQRTLILTALGLMLLVVIPAIIMAVIFPLKYRHTNINAKYNPNWSHSYKIEAIVWLIPILIIICLGIITWRSTISLEPKRTIISPIAPLKIEVVSMDWKWLFIYPQQGVASVNQIAFPINTPIEFKITSYSVMNSFFIPSLGSQIYAMPGMQTKLNLIANKPGTYQGISSAYSGRGFSDMKFTAVATPNVASFYNWIAKAKQAHATLNIKSLEKLAVPTTKNPVEFFSRVKPNLFNEVIKRFKSSTSSASSDKALAAIS
ncbi:MAG: ubiquinol oxidase subunit II [Candidatus Dasytiphilus stammeri]